QVRRLRPLRLRLEADRCGAFGFDAAVAVVGLVEVARVRAAEVDLRVGWIVRVVRDRDLLRPARIADGGIGEVGVPRLVREDEAIGDAGPVERERVGSGRARVDRERPRVATGGGWRVPHVDGALVALLAERRPRAAV